jgi:hypothetical protein
LSATSILRSMRSWLPPGMAPTWTSPHGHTQGRTISLARSEAGCCGRATAVRTESGPKLVQSRPATPFFKADRVKTAPRF